MFDSGAAKYYTGADERFREEREGLRQVDRYGEAPDGSFRNDYRESRNSSIGPDYYHYEQRDVRYRNDRRDDAYSDVRRDFYDYEDPYTARSYGQRRENTLQNDRVLREDYDSTHGNDDFEGRQAYGGYPSQRGRDYEPSGMSEDYERFRMEPRHDDRRGSGLNDVYRDHSEREFYRQEKPGSMVDDPTDSGVRDMHRSFIQPPKVDEGGQAGDRHNENEESFYEQLNEFQDKARQLQEIINDKQERVEYLEGIVADMDDENKHLRLRLEQDQQKAGDYAVDIEEQVNRLSEILSDGMEGVDQKISGLSEKLEDLQAKMPGEMQEVTLDTGVLTDEFDEQTKRMEDIFASISEKLTEIISKQQEPQVHNQEAFDEVFSDQKSFLSNSMLTQEKKMSESFDGMLRQIDGVNRRLDGVKEEISEKIHSEDVKVYRNLQDYIQEQDHREEDEKLLLKRYKALRNREYFNMVLTVVDIILGIVFLLIIM